MSDPPRTRRRDVDVAESPAETYTLVEGAEALEPARTGRPTLTSREAGLWADAWRELWHNPMFVVATALVVVLTLMAIWPQLFTAPFYPGETDPNACSLGNSLRRPSARHWFGFDLQGCDYYSRTIYGARVSMIVGVSVTSVAALIAIAFGSVAGYYGRFVDTVIARITDVWFAIPTILGALVALSVLGNAERAGGQAAALQSVLGAMDRFTNTPGLGRVVLVLILLGWPTMLRIMRASVLEKREADYVDAARALGAGDLRIMLRHILPNGVAPVIVYATIFVGIIISVEAALSFLGVGLQLPAISWGLMISKAQRYILRAPHLLFFPGVFLSVAVFSFIVMGDALRDALDPRLR